MGIATTNGFTPVPLCVLCEELGTRRESVAVPVVVVPVLHYPAPLYLRFKGALCRSHVRAFSLTVFANHFGPEWYEMASDHLRSVKKPAVNPYPDDSSFKWEEFIINPNFEPAPKEQCFIQFWEVKTLAGRALTHRWKS